MQQYFFQLHKYTPAFSSGDVMVASVALVMPAGDVAQAVLASAALLVVAVTAL